MANNPKHVNRPGLDEALILARRVAADNGLVLVSAMDALHGGNAITSVCAHFGHDDAVCQAGKRLHEAALQADAALGSMSKRPQEWGVRWVGETPMMTRWEPNHASAQATARDHPNRVLMVREHGGAWRDAEASEH